MERSIVSQRKFLQGQEAGIMEQMCTGQEDCLSGVLTAGPYGCLLAITMEGERGQADGAFMDLMVSSLCLDFVPVLLSDLLATPFI